MRASGSLMPDPKSVRIGQITMRYYEAGPSGGAPVVFCHGFPEIAFSWRHQLRALGEAGRWCVAPDQRGYGGTRGPADVSAYDMRSLTGDLLGLLDHLGAHKAIWCGHDWGGAVVWDMAMSHPDRTAGVIALNTPFTPRAPADPIEVLRNRFGEDMYMVHFQRPGEADQILERDVRKTMSFFMRRPPAGAPASAGLSGEPRNRSADTGQFALVRMVEAYDPSVDRRDTFLTDDEFDVFVDAFEATGFTGGINWYRNISRNWRHAEGREDRVRAPALMVTAENDAVLPPSAAEGMEAYVDDLEVRLVTGSGHWTQQEEPAQTNALILDWLDRRFPVGAGGG